MATTRVVRRRLIASLGLAATVALLLSAAYAFNLGATLQEQASDLLFAAGPTGQAPTTVIVGIDERSYKTLMASHGPMAIWPRSLYARALDGLTAAAPRVIVLEVLFEAATAQDGELAEAMRRAGNVVTPVVAQGPQRFDPRPGVSQQFHVFLRSAPAVGRTAVGEGVVNLTTARDSVVRALPLILTVGGEDVPALPLTVVARYARRPAIIDAPAAGGLLHAAGRRIPLDEADTLRINFLGPPSGLETGPFTIVPFVDVVHGSFDRELVRDKIVLLGVTLRGVDEHATPTTADRRMWGVEIIANAIETVLHQKYLVPARALVTISLVVGLALLAATLTALARPWVAALGILGLLIGYGLTSVGVFQTGTVLNLVYPPVALLTAFGLALGYRAIAEEREHQWVRDVMGRYLSPAVSQWVLADPARLRLAGERREMTVLFADLRAYTTLAQVVTPEVLVGMLNQYRTAMTEVIFRHDGVVAQFAGDGIEAFWNAPMDQPDHASRACAAALAMVARLRALGTEFERKGWSLPAMGVGVNTGPLIVGNMGSRHRLDYTAVGDAVNVGSRLEGLCKEYGTATVVGDATRVAAGDGFVFRFLDVVAVVGRAEPMAVWELVAPSTEVGPERTEFLVRWQAAVDLYRTRRWKDSLVLLDRLATEAADDGPVALYRQRARALLEVPPPDDWDGVFVAHRK
jgi:adenylate cyclase